jgi:hypothetical protein
VRNPIAKIDGVTCKTYSWFKENRAILADAPRNTCIFLQVVPPISPNCLHTLVVLQADEHRARMGRIVIARSASSFRMR